MEAAVDPRAIQVLADHVIDQIAAGEVIERPASVVKELVENALDAGARQVTVEIDRGGRELVRVVDDGLGMTREQARLALVRHATSKLRGLDDLATLRTMGFRGEALPSIASVSRMVLTTRARAEAGQAGTRIVIEAGKVTAEEEAGSPPGTQVEVRDLLFNLPARLKFMKGEATETAHVGETVARLAMAYPSVHFRLRSRGRTVLDAPPHRDGYERACAVLGPRMAGQGGEARRLHRSGRQEGRVAVEAFLGAPELAQTTTRGMHIYVGRRWVRDRGLVHAVLQGYGELVPRGRYPAAVIFVELEGAEVDVNVHPQKLEVRFADAQAVYGAVRHAVRDAVAQAPWLGEATTSGWIAATTGMGRPREEAARGGRVSEVAREYAASLSRSLFSWRRADGTPTGGLPVAGPARSEARWGQEAGAGGATTGADGAAIDGRGADAATPGADAGPREPDGAARSDRLEPGLFSSLRFLGQLDRTYLVCERDGELVLVDQHAAHERVAFQRLRERYQSRALPRQQLLFPQTLGLDRGQAAVAIEAQAALDAVGFEIEPFGDDPGGGSAFAVKSVPAELRPGEDPIALLRELIDELTERGGSRAVDQRVDSVLATIACHSVVRAGDELSAPEVEALFASLDAVEFRAHCPHGRPVLLRIRVDEIARRFGRT
ncbi:MAG TPA: DNA mismatch repair endonuclease MutL [Kofleriaceae bacterium]|nr:DNA mismatch repair endonuclease MutL [Kofleriaceae bacterium]